MDVTSFFSSNSYLFLPTSSNPKVALVVDDDALAQNAFKLYNPFSAKAQYLKMVIRFLFLNANGFTKAIASLKKQKKGVFIQYLETKLNTSLVSSVYFATANDKVVIQLQSNNKIIGYIKFPLNEFGVKHINNEIKAINILSEKKMIAPAILMDYFNETPYLFLQELEGKIKEVSEQELHTLLQKFKKQNKYALKVHPRILQLTEKLSENNLHMELAILEKVCQSSQATYYEVYEHGDFAPWNLITHKQQITPFDFEYFEKNGLEYIDLIKYYFQIGKLLKGKKGNELIKYIKKHVKLSEISILLQLFLIIEIGRKKVEGELYEFEINLMGMIFEKTH